jgi:hypothetical protein
MSRIKNFIFIATTLLSAQSSFAMKPEEFKAFVEKEKPVYANTEKKLSIRFIEFITSASYAYDGFFRIQHSPWERSCMGDAKKDEGLCEIRKDDRSETCWNIHCTTDDITERTYLRFYVIDTDSIFVEYPENTVGVLTRVQN